MSVLSRIVEDQDRGAPTWVTLHQGQSRTLSVRRCRLEITAGPDAGTVADFGQATIQIGRVGADLNLNDGKVSGLHCELRLQPDGYRLRDLSSTNGTWVKTVRIVDGFIAPGTTFHIGKTSIKLEALDDSVALPLWSENRLHDLVGGSSAMRRLFEMINRFAQSDATVLIQGETGTGKELIADAIHRSSPRRHKPFVVLDCSAIPEQLFEAQLFGHEIGAFTGAVRSTAGVFESAHGGTVFLDEIGELPLEVQAKLLRAVETRKVRRLGGNKVFAADVRIVAATNRDLATEVNRGTFRSDLYYRLAVAKLAVPSLRERREDIPMLVEHFVKQLADSLGSAEAVLPPDFAERAQRHGWPGNVRELRNAVERALLLPTHELEAMPKKQGDTAAIEVDMDLPFKVAKQQMIDEFDRRYIRSLLDKHDGNISAVSRAAGIERVSIYSIIRRLGLDKEDGEPDTTQGDE